MRFGIKSFLLLAYFYIPIYLTFGLEQTQIKNKIIEDDKYWMKLGHETILESLTEFKIKGIAKNAILFVGDGMGLSTVTAGRIFAGQKNGYSGEEQYLNFEKFRTTGLLKTYNVDRQIPDSAATATALFTGIKANYYTVGFDARITAAVCEPEVEKLAKIKNMITWGIESGKSTGMITTTRLTHATPAASYAHSATRDWECDAKIPEEEKKKGCKDIASQLIDSEPGMSMNVIMGGGESSFRAPPALLKQKPSNSSSCIRTDGRDLIEEWDKKHNATNTSHIFVKDRKELLAAPNHVERLLGIFNSNHLPYDMDRNPENDPSLEEMTEKAIEMLSRNTNGFVLIVEGGRIDHAHHDNLAEIALEEVVAFQKAIEKALKMTNENETLVVVTADHSHSFTMNGYAKRGQLIEGIGDTTAEGFVYETLSYSNGPGYKTHRLMNASTSAIKNLTLATNTEHTWKNITKMKRGRNVPHFAGFYNDYETHGGEDVPVYAKGPWAHLLGGVHEQTHVAYTIAYSLCIGPYANMEICRPAPPTTTTTTTTTSSTTPTPTCPPVKTNSGLKTPASIITLILFLILPIFI